MKDWATSLLEAESELKALDKLLTNYPPAQPYRDWDSMAMCKHLITAKSRLDEIEQYIMGNTASE